MINNQVVVIDVSFYQDNDYTPYKIDFNIAWRAGIDGVIIRAGQNAWVDEDYVDFCKNADAAKLPRGAYWFYDSRLSPVPQADLFADVVEAGGEFPALGLWGDYEELYGGKYGGEYNFMMFMERLKVRFPGKLLGIYTGPDYWTNHTSTATHTYFKQYPLWIANYDVTVPAIPKPWERDEWTLWQYTYRGDGARYGVESSRLDMNYFGGTLDAYRSFFNIPDYQPVVPPDLGDGMYNCKVQENRTPYVNLRDAPNGNDIGDVPPNTEFRADRIENDSLGRPWLHSIKDGMVGWILAAFCDYTEVQEGETHVLEVYLDGVLEYRKEF